MKKKGKKTQMVTAKQSSEEDSSEGEVIVKNRPRLDEMLKLTGDNDYRSMEQILAKAKFFTGVHLEDKDKMLEV